MVMTQGSRRGGARGGGGNLQAPKICRALRSLTVAAMVCHAYEAAYETACEVACNAACGVACGNAHEVAREVACEVECCQELSSKKRLAQKQYEDEVDVRRKDLVVGLTNYQI